MKSNYDLNKEKILDDYYKCIGTYLNCEKLYTDKESYIIKDDDTEDEKKIKMGMQEDILSNLGKVGEKAFKYIIGLENLKTSPNQDENTFESLWKKTNTLKDFAKKHGIKENDPNFIKLLNYVDDNNQKAHNFHYWFLVMDIIMKKTAKQFEKFIIYTIQTETLIKFCEDNNEFKYKYIFKDEDLEELSLPFRAAIFPNLIDMGYENIPSKSKIDIKKIIWLKKVMIKRNGDIFTRLRYASNNPLHEKFKVEEVYEIIKIIIDFIKMIHENNDNLDFDLEKTYAKNKSLEYIKHLNRSEEEINNLFSLNLIGTDLTLTAYETNYSYKTLKELLEMGIEKEDLKYVMIEKLHPRIIKEFLKRGITDYRDMRKYLDDYLENECPEVDYIYKKSY